MQWNQLFSSVERCIHQQRDHSNEHYVIAVAAYYAQSLKSIREKCSKHQRHLTSVLPVITQAQDMLRGNIVCQQQLLLAQSALSLRVAFEIRINLLYAFSHNDPGTLLNRLNEYSKFENLRLRERLGEKWQTPDFARQVQELLHQHPYWEDPKKKGRLNARAMWHGEGGNFRTMCTRLAAKSSTENFEDSYLQIYSMNSIFIHGSPLVEKMYTNENILRPIADVSRVSLMTVRTAFHFMWQLTELMDFFGITYSEKDIRFLNGLFVRCRP